MDLFQQSMRLFQNPKQKGTFHGIRVGNTLSVVNQLLKKTVLK